MGYYRNGVSNLVVVLRGVPWCWVVCGGARWRAVVRRNIGWCREGERKRDRGMGCVEIGRPSCRERVFRAV